MPGHARTALQPKQLQLAPKSTCHEPCQTMLNGRAFENNVIGEGQTQSRHRHRRHCCLNSHAQGQSQTCIHSPRCHCHAKPRVQQVLGHCDSETRVGLERGAVCTFATRAPSPCREPCPWVSSPCTRVKIRACQGGMPPGGSAQIRHSS